jgi:hypothetical protein
VSQDHLKVGAVLFASVSVALLLLSAIRWQRSEPAPAGERPGRGTPGGNLILFMVSAGARDRALDASRSTGLGASSGDVAGLRGVPCRRSRIEREELRDLAETARRVAEDAQLAAEAVRQETLALHRRYLEQQETLREMQRSLRDLEARRDSA